MPSGYYSIWKIYHDGRPDSFQQCHLSRDTCNKILADPSSRCEAWHLEKRRQTPWRPDPLATKGLFEGTKEERWAVRQARKDALFSSVDK